MQTHSIASPIPILIEPVARAARPLLEPALAMCALGELAGAVDRRCLIDVLRGWRWYVEACGREDLLAVRPPYGSAPLIAARERDMFAQLGALALATARNLRALDAERHWQEAARTFKQAAANAAATAGTHVYGVIREWERAGWPDVDELSGDVVSEFDEEATVAMACQAGAFALVLEPRPDGRASDAARAVSAALCRVEAHIHTTLSDLDLVERRRVSTGAYEDDYDVLQVCTLCDGLEFDHTPECPLHALDFGQLLARYNGALQGGR